MTTAETTEADVIAFLERKCAEVRERTGSAEATVSVTNRISVPAQRSDHAYWHAHAWGECASAETSEGAIAELVRAARKREQAAKLLAEAETLST